MSDRPSKRLPSRIGDVLDTEIDAPTLHRIASGVRARRSRRPVAGWFAGGTVVTSLAVASLAVALAFGISQRGSLEEREVPLAFEPGTTTTLADGSSIRVGEDTELSTLEASDRAIVLHLQHGRGEFSVTPGGPRRWTIECGLASVEVVGTVFSIDRTDDEVVVAVDRGAVLVRGEHVEDHVRRLGAGEELRVGATVVAQIREEPLGEGSLEDDLTEDRFTEDRFTEDGRLDEVPEGDVDPSERTAESDNPELAEATVEMEGREARRPQRRSSGPAAWERLVHEGEHEQAYEVLGRRGLARASRSERRPAQLFALADIARLSGHPNEAVTPLERLVALHPQDSRTPLAVFTLARIRLDQGQAAEAVELFEQARSLPLPGRLAAASLAYLATARDRSGDHAGAVRAAERYLAEYPNGPRGAALQALIDSRSSP
ncbi:MAG: FecR domain-containing protein [Myxococcota bacterium]